MMGPPKIILKDRQGREVPECELLVSLDIWRGRKVVGPIACRRLIYEPSGVAEIPTDEGATLVIDEKGQPLHLSTSLAEVDYHPVYTMNNPYDSPSRMMRDYDPARDQPKETSPPEGSLLIIPTRDFRDLPDGRPEWASSDND